MVVNAYMYELPADAAISALACAVPGDAVSCLFEASQFFDVEVDHFSGGIAFVSAHRLSRFQIAPAIEAVTGEDPSDGGF